jgi:hypothetical protein
VEEMVTNPEVQKELDCILGSQGNGLERMDIDDNHEDKLAGVLFVHQEKSFLPEIKTLQGLCRRVEKILLRRLISGL